MSPVLRKQNQNQNNEENQSAKAWAPRTAPQTRTVMSTIMTATQCFGNPLFNNNNAIRQRMATETSANLKTSLFLPCSYSPNSDTEIILCRYGLSLQPYPQTTMKKLAASQYDHCYVPFIFDHFLIYFFLYTIRYFNTSLTLKSILHDNFINISAIINFQMLLAS